MRSLPAGAHGVGFQQLHRQADQVVEIHRVERGQALLVTAYSAAASRSRGVSAPRLPVPATVPAFFARLIRLLHRVERIGLGARAQQVLDQRRGIVGAEIENPRRRPSLAWSICRKRRPSAWKVLTVSSFAHRPFGCSLATRSRISRAALLVKVIAAILAG
jgi:hypothetical protein